MTTYLEKSTELALDASVAVLVLTNEQCDDVELLPLKPRQYSEPDMAELRARWGGRGLRSVGVIGLVGAYPQGVYKEPLEPKEVSALSEAFLAYLHVLLCDSFEEHRKRVEIEDLVRLWSMSDPREA